MNQSEPETGMPRFDPHAFPRGVVAGEITANRAITVACRRWMADLERDDIYFDHDDWLGYEAMLDDLVINDGHQLSGLGDDEARAAVQGLEGPDRDEGGTGDDAGRPKGRRVPGRRIQRADQRLAQQDHQRAGEERPCPDAVCDNAGRDRGRP